MAKSSQRGEVNFSNLDKIFFPKTGYTKGEMVQYYINVAPHILPHLLDRPVTVIRFPDGTSGERFYEKNAPKFAPAWIKTHAVARRHSAGCTNYIVINDAASLAWCANIAALEFHVVLHKLTNEDQPTHVVFDFDPGEGSDLLTCIRVAFYVKAILDELSLTSFPKVSGSKGLQLYVPLNTKVTYAATSAFAKAVADLLTQRHPDLVVSEMTKNLRRKKVLIDWSQNSSAKTTVCVYSLRGKRDEPYVSMPVTWPELKKALSSKKPHSLFFSPEEALKRLKKKGDLFAPVLTLKQRLPKAFSAQDAPPEPLQSYRAKRDFTLTREPPPKLAKSARGKKARFVIQKHAASHLHYDLRLEMGGTLKSWAVPKGLSTEMGVKRSAIQVEDHPLAYADFEGIIPKGQYGGGTVMVWDTGTYDLLGGSHADGDLKLYLHGKKLSGEWHLFRIRSDDDKPVWLVAKSKIAAKPISARRDDQSVLTRRSMAKIAKDHDAEWQSKRR
jgi:bifunctional non-homologous end joining protein LigD